MSRIYNANIFALPFMVLLCMSISYFSKANTTSSNLLTIADPPEVFIDGGMIVCPGETVRVALRVKNFTDITSIQFSLIWDPAQLEYMDLIDVPGDFMNRVDTAIAVDGMYNMNWFHEPHTGVTLGDESTLMTFVFKVNGGSGNVMMEFTDLPTKFEVSQAVNGAPTLVNAISIDDSLMIQVPVVSDINIDNQEGMDANGAIDITVSSGVGPYSFLWSNDETTEDLMGLESGDYFVTITDARQCENVAGPYTVEMTSAVNTLPSLESLNIYPNPARNQIRIDAAFNQTENLRIRLTTLTGQLMLQQIETARTLQTTLDVSAFPSGMYLLELIGKEGVAVEKVILRK